MFISLSILNADLDHLDKFFEYPPIAYSPVNHLDIMDGIFVKETSFGPEVVEKSYEACPRAIVDVHLMVQNPDDDFIKYKEAHADYITFHLEIGDTLRRIELLKKLGVKVGLSINPDTKAEDLVPYLDKIDPVLVMSVWPGRGGQKFIESSIPKLEFLSNYKKSHNLHYIISVDGGINEETIPLVKPYVDLCVVGSAITKATNPYQKYLELYKMTP